MRRGLGVGLLAALLTAALLLASGDAAVPGAGAVVGFDALYHAYYAGLPAGVIRIGVAGSADSYRDTIDIRSTGLPRLVTHFRGRATSEGSFAADAPPNPARYDSLYDLHKRRDRRLSMRFDRRDGAVFADRGPGDTSGKPPLAAIFRRNVLDPMSALAMIRIELARHRRAFTIPVYDGARRFDVVARVLPLERRDRGVLHLTLSLDPIAGFKGESSDEGDPDNAPRTVALRVSDDARLMPLSMRVPLYYLPLVVEFAHLCTPQDPCGG